MHTYAESLGTEGLLVLQHRDQLKICANNTAEESLVAVVRDKIVNVLLERRGAQLNKVLVDLVAQRRFLLHMHAR